MVDTGTTTGKAAAAAALATALIGVSVLIGWTFRIDALKSVLPGIVTMNPATALAMILAGGSLGLSLDAQGRPDPVARARRRLAARALAAGVVAIGLLRLVAIVTGWDLGVDQWMFPGQVASQLPLPSRIAPNVAFNFLLAGVALMLVDQTSPRIRASVGFAAILAGCGALLAFTGYVFHIKSFYRLGSFIPMALNTATAFVTLVSGILLAQTDRGLLAVMAGHSAGAPVARRLLPAAILVPVALGFLKLKGEHAGLFDADFGMALFAMANILVFTLLVCWSALLLSRIDVQRDEAEAGAQRQQAELRVLFDLVPAMIWFKDTNNGILRVNQRAAASVGRTVAEIEGRPTAEICPEDAARFYADDLEVIRTGQPKLGIVEPVRHREGKEIWVQTDKVPYMGLDGAVIGIVVMAQDVTERKRTEESLRLLNSAVLQSRESILITDGQLDLPGPKILFVNPAFTTMTGYTPAEVMGKTPRLLQGPRTDRAVMDRLRRNLGQGEGFEGQAINYRKDGTAFDLEWQIAPIRDTTGKTTHFVAIQRDITARQQVEDALRESNEKFRLLTDNITDAFWIRSADGREVLYLSPAFERIWGRSTATLYANPRQWPDFIVPEDRARALEAFASLREHAPGIDLEYRITRPDGEIRWVRLRGFQVRDAAGELIRLTGIVTDITEPKLLALQMELLRTEYAVILNSIGEGVHWVGADGLIKYENPAAARMLGYEVTELLGRPAHSTMHHTRADGTAYPQSECGIYRTLSDGVTRRATDEVFWRKDGRAFAVDYVCTPVRERSGRSAGVVVVFADITERKRLEALLIQSQKLETVGKLAGGVAHEFNSILTAIIGQSELLLADLPAGNPSVKNALEIRAAAGRAASLTRQLLAHGRKQILRPEILDLNAVITGMENTLRHLAGRETDVRLAPAAGLRTVLADAGQIEQVIMNMAMNAAEAMSRGGKLTLETANVTLDENYAGRLTDVKPGEYVMLAITDTGAGMSEAVQARVFEPFFTTKGVGEGTGLGLATCYGIIKQSGGHISVYSEPGRGTTFKIYLPQAGPQASVPAARLNVPDLPRGTECILLVEDDPALREMAATLLERLGYTVLKAANGSEALRAIQRQGLREIDLLFTDLVMPGMSGQELAQQARALYPRTRTLFTSAYTANALNHQGGLHPGAALLQKPFTPSALARKLREVLDQSAPDGASPPPVNEQPS